MIQSNNENGKLSILIDKKHNTVYCVDPKGRSYIQKSTENRPKGDRK